MNDYHASAMKRSIHIPLLVAFITLVTSSPLGAKVASIAFSNLVATSDLIVVAKVESVSAPLILGKKCGKAKVTEVWKGSPIDRVKFLASPTWTCDISEAVKGESVLLFLKRRDKSEEYSIAHAGRGRFPLRTVDGKRYSTFWPDVILPKDVATIAGPDSKSDFIRSVELNTLRELVKASLGASLPAVVIEQWVYARGQGMMCGEIRVSTNGQYSWVASNLWASVPVAQTFTGVLPSALLQQLITESRSFSLRNGSRIYRWNGDDSKTEYPTGVVSLIAFVHEQHTPPLMKSTLQVWELLPPESAVPVDFTDATIVGTLQDSDKRSLTELIGRLKGVLPKIHHVTLSFPDRTVAALIKAGPQEIYCVKDIHTEWNIVGVDTSVP